MRSAQGQKFCPTCVSHDLYPPILIHFYIFISNESPSLLRALSERHLEFLIWLTTENNSGGGGILWVPQWRPHYFCPLCNRSEIGDEFHYLLKCTHSSLSHMLGIFLESLYSINSNFTNMSCKALFLYIMSMCDENITNLSASYIENIINCYASEL